MEKYAVVIDEEKTKTSSKDRTCPQCGKKLPEVGGAMSRDWCPECGTEPFEKKNPEAVNLVKFYK